MNNIRQQKPQAMNFQDALRANDLPLDFGPSHADWNIPSKRNRYNSIITSWQKATNADREDFFVANGLPKGFGPSHPDWNTPSKRNRYELALTRFQGSKRHGTPSIAGTRPIIPPGKTDGTIGVAISTYFGPDTHPKRLGIFLTSIYTLLASRFPGKIVVVDDGSPNQRHTEQISKEARVTIIYRHANGGIAKCKNTGIKALDGCEYLFLADDDLIYNGDWWTPYISASQKTGIQHFTHYSPQFWHNPQSEVVEQAGVQLIKHYVLNGVLLFIAKNMIQKVGGFKPLPYKYGGEHGNFTDRCIRAGGAPFYCDVAGADEFVYLHMSSYRVKSMEVDSRAAELLNSVDVDDQEPVRVEIEE